MNLERAIRLLAGSMILVSVVLTLALSPWWLLLTAFVGLNLVQSSVTRFCPAESMMARTLGARIEGSTCAPRERLTRG